MNINSLQTRFAGEILTPESTEYEAARRIWNGMIDRKPAAIAPCSSPQDVIEAVRFAAEENIYPAVRAGGHNVAGLATIDSGFVIDVSQMKAINLDEHAQFIQAQAGLTWGEFDESNANTRARDHRWISLQHGNSRLDAWRRSRLANGPLRSDL